MRKKTDRGDAAQTVSETHAETLRAAMDAARAARDATPPNTPERWRAEHAYTEAWQRWVHGRGGPR